MRTALLFATLGLLAAAARAQPQPATPPAAPAAPAAASAKPAEAPSVPTGETPEEAAAPAPESGTISKVNVQGNRRVEPDAIRAQIPIKAGDRYDKEKIQAALLA